ncbi:MAG: rRNA adenine N-6-methyltransferase family protein [Chloroflexota bacterium]|nr:rRNA adenine N-6-methyltransferase family protein [Chloroflexota bacterium]
MGPAVSGSLADAIRRLEEHTEAARHPSGQGAAGFARFAERHDLPGWEGWFSPYDDETYEAVLSQIRPNDVVFDIGAGDLRLALRMAGRARKVVAVEVNPLLVAQALEIIGLDLPRNLHVVCANAFDLRFPSDVTVAVLLMRHCRHFRHFLDRLEAAGCQQLLTSARWRTGVESIDLTAPGLPFEDVHEGWYACRCGATGYVGTGERPDAAPVEVMACPACWAPESDHTRHPEEKE